MSEPITKEEREQLKRCHIPPRFIVRTMPIWFDTIAAYEAALSAAEAEVERLKHVAKLAAAQLKTAADELSFESEKMDDEDSRKPEIEGAIEDIGDMIAKIDAALQPQTEKEKE